MSKNRRWYAAPFPPVLCGYVRGVAFSPDGELVATAGDDGVVRYWLTSTRALHHAHAVPTGEDGVNALAWVGDSVFVGNGRKTWRSCRWSCRHEEALGLGAVVGATRSAVVVADPEQPGFLRWWSVAKRAFTRTTHGGPMEVSGPWCLAAHAPGALEVRGDQIVLVALKDGSTLGSIPVPPPDPSRGAAAVDCLAVAADGTIACAGDRNVWLRVPGGEWCPVRLSDDAFVCALAFSPDGKTLAVAGRGVDLVDVESGEVLLSLARVNDGVSVAFAARGPLVHVAYDDLGVATWDLREHKLVALHRMPHALAAGTLTHVVAAPEGLIAVTANATYHRGYRGGLTTWDVVNDRALTHLPVVGAHRFDAVVAWPWVATTHLEPTSQGGAENRLVLRDGRTGWVAAQTWTNARVGNVAVHASGKAAACGRLPRTGASAAPTIEPPSEPCLVLDAITGTAREYDSGHRFACERLQCFSPDGRRVLFGDRAVRIVDLESGRISPTLLPRDGLSACAWSPDGTRIAVGLYYTRQVCLWHDGAFAPQELQGHRAPVRALAFSPDGRRLVTTGMDGQVGIWSTASGRLLAMLPALRADATAPMLDR